MNDRTSPCAVTVIDEFDYEMENLVDGAGRPSDFQIEIVVRSDGNGDQITMDLSRRIRLAAYQALDEFDEELG